MADRISRIAVIRGSHRLIEAAKLSLPLSPKPIDVAVKQEKQRIFGSRPNAGNGPAPARMGRAVRVALHPPENRKLISQSQRLWFGDDARPWLGIRIPVVPGPAIDALDSIGLPEL